MAKLQPVFKSELYLTEVQHVADKARYFFSSYIYDPPDTTMAVAITGFTVWQNNTEGNISGVHLTAPTWFEIPYVSQIPEVAVALARASTPSTATCKKITKPSPLQSIVLSSNANGCNFHDKNTPSNRPQKSGSPFWDNYFGKVIRFERRRLMKQIAGGWKHKLSPAQRAAWSALAAGVTWINYKGVAKTGNGFQLFVAVQTERRYTIGIPWYNTNLPIWPIYLDPPAAWDPPAAPAMGSPERIFDAWVQIPVSNAPALSDWWSACPYVQKGNPATGTKRRSYHPVRDFLSDFGSDPPLLYLPVDFPIGKLNVAGSCTIGYRFLNLNTGVFSDPTWVTLT